MTVLKGRIDYSVGSDPKLERFLRSKKVWTEFLRLFDHGFFNSYTSDSDGICRSMMSAFKWSDDYMNGGNPRYDKWCALEEEFTDEFL